MRKAFYKTLCLLCASAFLSQYDELSIALCRLALLAFGTAVISLPLLKEAIKDALRPLADGPSPARPVRSF